MIELTIPQLGEDTKNVKDLVFTVLTQEQPLSLIKIHNHIKNQYNLSVTYQAVRKAVNTLLNQSVIVKENKEYSISKEWAMKIKSFFDSFLMTYNKEKKSRKFNTNQVREDYAVYTFNNLMDMDNFWSDSLIYSAQKEKKDKTFISYYHYPFWFLINLGRETMLFDTIKKLGFKAYQIFLSDNALTRWSSNLYKQMGVHVYVSDDRKMPDNIAMSMIGDNIIQVHYSENILRKLREVYRNKKSIHDLSVQEITKLAHFSCEIKFVVIKSHVLSKTIKETYLKLFSK